MDIHLEEVRPLSKPVSKRAVFPEAPLETESLKKSPFVSHQQSKALFFSGLSRLLGGGVPVLRALSLVSSYQMRDEKFRIVVSRMAASVREGRMLSQAMAVHPSFFGMFEIGMVRAGEISGTLPKVLSRAADELKRQEDIKRRIREAATYPIFVIGMGFVTLVVVLLFVIPRVSLIYQDFHGELPAVTKAVMQLGKRAPYLLAGFISLLATAFFAVKKRGWVLFLESVPLLSAFVKTTWLARSSYLMATLLDSGVTIRESIQITMDAIPQKKEEFSRMLDAVSQGGSVHQSMEHVLFFGEQERALVLASEESGSLSDALAEIAQTASDELTAKIDSILKVLEPSLILAIGVLVGFLVMAMILPITEIDALVAR